LSEPKPAVFYRTFAQEFESLNGFDVIFDVFESAYEM